MSCTITSIFYTWTIKEAWRSENAQRHHQENFLISHPPNEQRIFIFSENLWFSVMQFQSFQWSIKNSILPGLFFLNKYITDELMTAEKLPVQINILNIFLNYPPELASHSCCTTPSHFETKNGYDYRWLQGYIFNILTDINTSVHVWKNVYIVLELVSNYWLHKNF